MKKWMLGIVLSLWAMSATAYAGPADGTYFSPGVTNATPDAAAYGQVVRPIDNFAKAGEAVNEDVQKVEEWYSTLPSSGSNSWVATDTLIKSAKGYVKDVQCYSDAAATAGNIKLLDSVAAGTGNVLMDFDVLAADYSKPVTISLQTPATVGLYLDFTTTTDMKCMVRYR